MSYTPAEAVSCSVNWTLDARQYTLVLKVHAGDGSDGIIAAVRAPGVPKVGDFFSHNGESDEFSFCTGKQGTRDKESEMVFITLN